MHKKDGLILQYDILRIHDWEGLYPTEPLTCGVIASEIHATAPERSGGLGTRTWTKHLNIGPKPR